MVSDAPDPDTEAAEEPESGTDGSLDDGAPGTRPAGANGAGAPGAAREAAADVGSEACSYTDYRDGDPAEDLPATGEGATGLAADVWDALYGIDDPEMPVSIVDLGLIYGVDVGEDGAVTVDMTLTYSGCPARNMLMDEVRRELRAVEGVADVDLRLVWSPDWNVSMVTDRGKDRLREFGLSV